MLQMLLSDWIVRIFLLYLFVVGGLALILHRQPAISRPVVSSPLSDIRDRWAARATWWVASCEMWFAKYPTRDNSGIRIGYNERNNSEFWRDGDGLRYT